MSPIAVTRVLPRALPRALLAPMLASLIFGCSGDGLTPDLGLWQGTYALETANGTPLPFVVRMNPNGESLRLMADTLTFGLDRGVFERRVTHETDARGGLTILVSGATLEYLVRSDSVTIGRLSPCPINASCIANSEGRFIPGGLRVTSNMRTSDNQPILLRYIRIADR
jgi:hypothetical protein